MFASLKKLFSSDNTAASEPASPSIADVIPEVAQQAIEIFSQQLAENTSPPPLLCSQRPDALSEQWLPALSNAIALNQALSQLAESDADSYAICWLTELPHRETGEQLPVIMIETAQRTDSTAQLLVQSLQALKVASQPVITGQVDNALLALRQLPITPDQLPQNEQQKLPALFCLPVTALYLALEEFSKRDNSDFVAAMQSGQDRLAELAESGSLLSQSLCQLAVNAMLSRTQSSMLPGISASYAELQQHLASGIDELKAAVARQNFSASDAQQFTEELLSVVDAVFGGVKDNQSYQLLLQFQQQLISTPAKT